MRRRREWREVRREKEWWEGNRRERQSGEKHGWGEKREDDKRERDGTCMGGKEVGGGGNWRGGRELRGEDGGAVQEGREYAKKGARWEEGHFRTSKYFFCKQSN